MELKEFFVENNKVAVAFSGGVDSSYLLYSAKENGADVKAYYVKSQFQPQFEYDDALRLAEELDIPLKIIELDVLAFDMVRNNNSKRCYYCKQRIFSAIIDNALADGYTTIVDGTNASDDADDRPGMKALEELKVLSPLRLCGITKDEVRLLSKKAGLFTWDKPAYACLATRIKPNEEITASALHKVEKAEMLMVAMGFLNHRVRVSNNVATVIVKPEYENLLIEKKAEIISKLKNQFDDIIF